MNTFCYHYKELEFGSTDCMYIYMSVRTCCIHLESSNVEYTIHLHTIIIIIVHICCVGHIVSILYEKFK